MCVSLSSAAGFMFPDCWWTKWSPHLLQDPSFIIHCNRIIYTLTCKHPPGVWSRAIEFFWHGSQWLFLTVTGTMTRSSLYRRPFIQDCTRDTVSGESRFSVTDPCAHAQWNGRNVAGISSCSRRDNGQRWSMREGSSASGQNERRVRWTHRVLWSRPAFLKFF